VFLSLLVCCVWSLPVSRLSATFRLLLYINEHSLLLHTHTHTHAILYTLCYTTQQQQQLEEKHAHEKGNKNVAAAALARLSVGWLTFFKVLDAVFRSS